MDGFTFKNNIVENNDATASTHGFWCDLACSNGVIVDNLFRSNGGSGIFYEVSDTGIIASNLIYDNGGYGIRLGSANTRVYNNTIVNNTGFGGLWFYDDSRSYGYGGTTDAGPDTTNLSFVNNIVADTKNSNTILRAQGQTGQTNTQPDQFFTTVDYNSYLRTSSSQNLMRWIPAGASETDYKSLATFTSGTSLDAHSGEVTTGVDPYFINLVSGDYHVRSSGPAYHSGTALPADVAAAIGVSTATGQNRGALIWPGN